jgi:pectate lyase
MYKHILFVLILSIPVFSQQAPYVLSSPFGYAGNVTGGAGGSVETVTTAAALKTALGKSGKLIILVKGTLTFTSQMTGVITDKTIIGLPNAKLVSADQTSGGSGIWQVNDGSKNIIIRNLKFEGPGAYDVDGKDLLFVRGTNVWVDHCEFKDGVDGNFDISNKGDNITVTWNVFGYDKPPKAGGSGGADDHRFSNLISGSDGTAPDDGNYNVTLAYNWWTNGARERMPRARNSTLHLLNNYVNTDAPGSKAIGLSAGEKGTSVYVENCDFAKVGKVLDAGYGGSPKVTIVGSNTGNGNTNGGAPKPAYAYTALSWESVEAAVTGVCGAGAKLQVNESTGAVSCGGAVLSSSSVTPSSSSVVSSSSSVTSGSSAVSEVLLGSGEYIDSLILYDVTNAANWSIQSNLRENVAVFGDREHIISSVSSSLSGAEWIRTAMETRTYTSPAIMAKFKMKKAGTVYIAYEDRITTKPAWLASGGFTAVSQTMTVTETGGTARPFTIYGKACAQGETVILGVNSNNGTTSSMMYLVAVKANEPNSIVKPQYFMPQQAASHYYSLKGEPLGAVKPKNAGVYLVKQGSSVRKIMVR